jgi:hypothetical protein
MIRVRLPELVHFYDADAEAHRHASPVKGLAGEELNIALLCECLKQQGMRVEILPERCTAPGNWLDAWIRATSPDGTHVFYQVEVKSWSFHGFGGGQPLAVDVTPLAYSDYLAAQWNGYWDALNMCFRDEKLNKVLTRMAQFEHEPVMPLACLWSAVHPQGIDEPLFEVPCQAPPFMKAAVFSASVFARKLIAQGRTYLDLEMPAMERRLRYVNLIFSPSISVH